MGDNSGNGFIRVEPVGRFDVILFTLLMHEQARGIASAQGI